MVEAARKYNRVVQTGTQSRSNLATVQAIDFLNDGGLGEIYMTKGLCLKPRGSIGHTKNGAIPEGVNWDAFLGPNYRRIRAFADAHDVPIMSVDTFWRSLYTTPLPGRRA